jgi:hypothetical protein
MEVGLKVHHPRSLVAAAGFLAIGVWRYPDRNDASGVPLHQYMWIAFLVVAGLWFLNAFSPNQSRPDSKAD